jgi:pimeloyl-[acyl-carrier protein] methyl ester esterase
MWVAVKDGVNMTVCPIPTLYTHTAGAGPDVVLAHGWGMHSGVWEKVAEGLADDYRVTVLDLPGHGYSQGASGAGATLEDWAAAVIAATPEPATWIGWSLGGLVAQQVALMAPERVSRLALVNSTPCFVQRPGWPHGIALAVLHRFAEELREDYRAVLKRFIALEVHGSEHASAQLKQLKAMLFQHGDPDISALEDGLSILETSDLRAQLADIACPTLLLMGQRDQLVPVAVGETMLKQLSNARLRVFARAGHAPFFSHLPEFIAELRVFLDA